jgi:hypothetical protein
MAEILGFSPHGNASVRSQSEKWHQMAREAARKVVEAVKEEKRPSDFVTQKSLENVVRYMMATGGSTNSLLHIPALHSPDYSGSQNHLGVSLLSQPPLLFWLLLLPSDAISHSGFLQTHFHVGKIPGSLPWHT